MKILNGLLPLFLSALLICSCGGGNKEVTGTAVKGRVTLEGYEGRYVYLETTTPESSKVDSTLVEDGRFSFNLNDSTPQVYQLVLKGSDNDVFPITLPIVSEKGTLGVTLGEYVLTSGTPLNDKLQDFLLAVSSFADKQMQGGELDMEKIQKDFATLVEGHILMNIDNPLGSYIFENYRGKLSLQQRESIEKKAQETNK